MNLCQAHSFPITSDDYYEDKQRGSLRALGRRDRVANHLNYLYVIHILY